MADIDLDAIEARAKAAMRVLDGDDLDAPIHDVDEMIHDQIALVAEVRHLTAALSKANYAAVAAYDGNALIQQANAHRDDALDTLREIVEAVADGSEVSRTVRAILTREGYFDEGPSITPAEEATLMRKALRASLRDALGDDTQNAAVALVLLALRHRHDGQTAMRMIPGLFGPWVYGRVLLFQQLAHTPLAGDARALSSFMELENSGLTTADLCWPADVLEDDAHSDAAEWDPEDRARFDAAVQAWRDAHPDGAR